MVIDGVAHATFREICPRDFYWFNLVENDYPDMSESHKLLLILAMLSNEGESVLDRIPRRSVGPLIWWSSKNLIEERVMTLESWLTTAFHLQKQRWDASIDWLEEQPMSKVILMMNIQGKFNQDQEREMKKGRKK